MSFFVSLIMPRDGRLATGHSFIHSFIKTGAPFADGICDYLASIALFSSSTSCFNVLIVSVRVLDFLQVNASKCYVFQQ